MNVHLIYIRSLYYFNCYIPLLWRNRHVISVEINITVINLFFNITLVIFEYNGNKFIFKYNTRHIRS